MPANTRPRSAATPTSIPASRLRSLCNAPFPISAPASTTRARLPRPAVSLQCWGTNSVGQLGNGAIVDFTTPRTAAGLTSGVARVATGSDSTCVVLTNGTVDCWGSNAYTQLGDGTSTDRHVATPVQGASGVSSVALGLNHGCLLTTGGVVQCWGNDSAGQTGPNWSSTPETILSGATQISTGWETSCALTTSGTVMCWGNNSFGELGNGTSGSGYNATPTQVSGLSNVVEIAAGLGHTCARTSAGAIYCWGLDWNGQVGNGTQSGAVTTPQLAIATGATELSAGSASTCAVVNGAAKCWGWNNVGQLGNGTTTDSSTPVAVSGLTSGVTKVSVGGPAVGWTDDSSTACAIVSGAIKCWGGSSNTIGMLGNGTNNTSTTPVTVSLPNGTTADQIAVAHQHVCARTSTNGGTTNGVECWGTNRLGQSGVDTDSFTAVPVTGLSSGVVAVRGGERSTCALTSAGGLQCWGDNESGQLGNDSLVPSSVPVAVQGLTSGVTSFTLGAGLRLRRDDRGRGDVLGRRQRRRTRKRLRQPILHDRRSRHGTERGRRGRRRRLGARVRADRRGGVQCWGNNSWGSPGGQLGNGTTTDSHVPVQVTGLTSGVVAIAASGDTGGNAHSCALLSTGVMQCWGHGLDGESGDGTWNTYLTPHTVSLPGPAVAMGLGGDHSCAILSGGTVYCWGDNSTRAHGNGTTTNSNTPVAV